MGISNFSKVDYLRLAPKSYKCPFCGNEHPYDKTYLDYYGRTKNKSLLSYNILYDSLVLTCSSNNRISLCFDPFRSYYHFQIHGSICKNNYYDKIDGEGKVSLEEMEDCEDGTITFKFTISSFKNIYLKFIYDQENSFGAVYLQKMKAELASRKKNLRQKERELNAQERNLQTKEQEKREKDLRSLEQVLQQKEKELKEREKKLQEAKTSMLTTLNQI